MAPEQQSPFLGGVRTGWRLAAGALALAVVLSVLLVRALQPSDPVIATVPLGVFPGTAAIDDLTGHAFIGNSMDTDVEMLDSANGAVLRTLTVGSNGGAHPEAIRVDPQDHRVFVASDDGLLSTLDARSGSLLRTSTLGGSVQLLALDQRRHRLFVANLDTSTLRIVDAHGSLVLTVNIGTLPQALTVDERSNRVFVAGQDDGTLTMLNARTGAVLGVSHVGMLQGVQVDAQLGMVFLSSARGSGLKVLDAQSAALLRTIPLERRGTVPQTVRLAVDDTTGHLFVASGTRVRMLDVHTGRLLRRMEVGSSVTALAVDPQSHSCLALAQGPLDGFGHLLGRGAVVVLDSGSGAVRRTVVVGVGPRSISVDVRRRRALVINTGLNPDGTFAHARPPDPTWVQRLPWLGGLLPRQDQGRMPPDGRGSLTLLDLSQV